MSDSEPQVISEISHEPSKFDVFLDKHQKKLILAAIFLFCGLIAYLVFDGLGKMTEQREGSKLFNASTVEDYDAIASSSESNTAVTALMLKAKLQSESDIDGAMDTLKQVINNHPAAVVAKDAKLHLALLQIEAGLIDEAKAGLISIKDDANTNYTIPIAELALANIELRNENVDTAKSLSTKAQEKLQYVEFINNASNGQIYADVAQPKLVVLEAPKVQSPVSKSGPTAEPEENAKN